MPTLSAYTNGLGRDRAEGIFGFRLMVDGYGGVGTQGRCIALWSNLKSKVESEIHLQRVVSSSGDGYRRGRGSEGVSHARALYTC